MARIASYVFLDIETSGLPVEECNKTKITELSLVAVKRPHILNTRAGGSPRVQHKLTLCFNPRRLVHPNSTTVTGLCNDLLEHETPFSREVFDTINNFLNLLTKPVCLIAQNGLNFDYPILKKHMVDLGVSFPDDLMCADSLHAFYDILNIKNETSINVAPEPITQEGIDEVDLKCIPNTLDMQKQNETTPIKRSRANNLETPQKGEVKKPATKSNLRRKLFWKEGKQPTDSYKLKDIYERLLKRPAIVAHRAENDCVMALECSVAVSEEFVQWVDENHSLFTDVKPMSPGVPLGQ